jgi:hypothetical protein
MVATVNLPGSSHFKYFVGSKAECKAWLEKTRNEYEERFGGTWYNAYSPARTISNAKAKQWKYRDGSPVIKSLHE